MVSEAFRTDRDGILAASPGVAYRAPSWRKQLQCAEAADLVGASRIPALQGRAPVDNAELVELVLPLPVIPPDRSRQQDSIG